MSFLHRVLEPPAYGWERQPTHRELWSEFARRIDVLRSRKNWVAFTGVATTLLLAIPCALFFVLYFDPWLWALGFVYGVVGAGCYGTIWFHRHCTHKAFAFSSPFWRFVTRNLVPKVIPEETYVVSHHVHHALSDQVGDPYHPRFGALYGFLADTNHQPIHKSLTREDYERVTRMLSNVGHRANSYEQYLVWGSVIHPLRCWLHVSLNWAFWYVVFHSIGGNALACALFGGVFIWTIGIRTFNFTGHGGGEARHAPGVDFDRRNLSINQYWPGFVAGEWHNNHHLYPSSARSGFLPHQIDLAWYYIKLLHWLGGVSHYKDFRWLFHERHYGPHLAKRARAARLDASSSGLERDSSESARSVV